MATKLWTTRIVTLPCAWCLCAILVLAAAGPVGAGSEDGPRRDPPTRLPDDSLLLDVPTEKKAEASPVAPEREPAAETGARDHRAASRTAGPGDAGSKGKPSAAETTGADLGGSSVATATASAATTSDSGAPTVSSEQQALPSVGPTDPARAAREAQPLGAADRSGPAQPPTTAFSIGGLLRTLFALAVVVALIFACRAVVKRATRGSNSLSVLLSAGGRAPSGVLEVLGRYPISKQTTLVLLKIDRRVLLLSQGEHGFQTLAEITDADEVASILMKTSGEQSERLSDRFASIFQQFERGGGVENTPMAPEVVDLTGPRNPLASLRMRLAGLQEKRA